MKKLIAFVCAMMLFAIPAVSYADVAMPAGVLISAGIIIVAAAAVIIAILIIIKLIKSKKG